MLFNRKVKNWLLVSFYLLLFMPGQAQEKVLSHFASQDTARVMSLIKQGGFLIHSNIDSALVLLTEGMLLSKRAGFEDGIGYAMIYIGLAHTYNGDHNKGIDFYKKALPYCQNAKYIEDALPNLYIAMGASFIHHGDYIKANYFNYKSLLYMQKHMPNSQNLINPYVNMVFIQSKLGRHRQALEYGLVAKKLAIEKDLPLTLAKVFLNIGTQYTFLGQEDSAIYYFDSAAVLFQQHGLIDYQQAALTSIGDVMSQLGNYEQAIPYYKRSMQLSSTTSPLYGTIIPAYSLGIALFHLKKYKEAEVILVAGIEEATMTGFTQDKEKAHETLAQVYEAMGMYKKALQQYRISKGLNDSIVTVGKVRAIHEVEVKYNTAQKDKEIAQKQLILMQQEKKITGKNIVIFSISGSVFLLSIFGVLFYRYKQKIRIRDSKIQQLKAMMEGEEKERTRISRELHDGIGGMLTGVKMNIKSVQKQHDRSTIQEELKNVMYMLHAMGTEIHKTAHNLMPDILLKHSFQEALHLYCEQLETGDGLKINLQFHGALGQLDKRIELPLYRIVQELIQNIIKHAAASQAAIQIKNNGDFLYISVEDNGVGFDHSKPNSGLGLRNIEARIHALSGFFSIESTLGMGTIVYIEIDLKKTMASL